MANRTLIDWADYTWNPVWGCRGSCPYCYARSMARRFGIQVCGRDDFAPTWVEKNFQRPFPRRPSRIFVNSMSDVADWEWEWLDRVMQRVGANPHHLFLFLTKRPEKVHCVPDRNALFGISVTDQVSLDRVERRFGRSDFLSIEPLLGPVHLATKPRWIIVGAETGNRRERVVAEQEWLREIFGYCAANGIPLFFKGSLRHLWPAGAYFPQELPALPDMKGK
jgi:protein gp37